MEILPIYIIKELKRLNKNYNGGIESTHWKIADLDFSTIDLAQVALDENLFYLVTSASFIESGSSLYTQNLVEYYRDEPEIEDWLRNQWEVEELQHGQALRAYVNYVWPEFDWETGYRHFFKEYSDHCKVELLAPTKGLEMVAHCAVEASTAALYRALSRCTTEPILKEMASLIGRDEVSHYKYFYRYFRRFRKEEGLRRHRIFWTLCHRMLEIKNQDTSCALRHVVQIKSPSHANDAAYIKNISKKMNEMVRRHLSADMTIKMVIRPLDLPPMIESMVTYPLTQIMNKFFLR